MTPAPSPDRLGHEFDAQGWCVLCGVVRGTPDAEDACEGSAAEPHSLAAIFAAMSVPIPSEDSPMRSLPTALVHQHAHAIDWRVGSAKLSPDGRYRYRLMRGREHPGPQLHWIMLNPSVADATTDDPTIRKCVGFAKRAGFRAITVHNLFAARATDPKHMKTLPDPVGPDNHTHITRLIEDAGWAREPIVCAWGAHGAYMQQDQTTLGWLDAHPRHLLWCLGRTAGGLPLHPLMIGYETPWQRMDGRPFR